MSHPRVSLGSRHSQLAAYGTIKCQLRRVRAAVKLDLFDPETRNRPFGLSLTAALFDPTRIELPQDPPDVALQHKIQVADGLMAVSKIANRATHQVEIQTLRRGQATELINNLKLFRGKAALQ